MASRAEQLRMGRISRKMSLAPSLIMATEESGLPDRKPTYKDYICEHMKTIVTIIMIFGTLAVIVVIVMVHKTRFDEEQAALREACLDVAVVGAGISGSYAAWRMRDQDYKVHLFEATDRIGGRMHTYRLGNTQNLELGALYYIPEEHPLLNWTIHVLNLHPQNLPQLNHAHATYYLRKTHLQHPELSTNKLPYLVQDTEQHKYPQQLLDYYLSTVMLNTSYPITDPLSAQTIDHHRLYFQGFINVLSRIASTEGINYLSDTAYLSSQFADHNAALLSQIPMTPPSTIRTVSEGMDEIPKRLAERFENSSSRHLIRTNMKLKCIHKVGRLYKLTFLHTETKQGTTLETWRKENVCAKKVVLAMPRRSLENVQLTSITEGAYTQDDPRFIRLDDSIRSVNPVQAIRVYFVYDTPWWRGKRYASPHQIQTDLPIHRVMDFVTRGYSVLEENTSASGHRPNLQNQRKYVLMVSDIDGSGTTYLDSMFPNETTIETNITKYAAAVKDITRHLAYIYHFTSVSKIPDPVAIIAKNWQKSPSGSGWDFWGRGVNWVLHAQNMLKHLFWEELYIVGSSYCSGKCQLYVEGALQTVEVLFKNIHCNLLRRYT